MITAKQVYYFSRPLHVLYVEDDSNLRADMSALFESFFERIDTAVDGVDGLEKYNNHPYDIVITDINMPRMNGIEMAAKIHEMNPEQKIIAVSAHDESDILINLIQTGISSFILKPVQQQSILNILYPVCRDAHAQRDNIELYRVLNEERAKLKENIRLLEAQINATNIKHSQLGELMGKRDDGVSDQLINDYFAKDEDEGDENVLFLKDDCDEMREMFNEMPERMMQYTLTHNPDYILEVVNSLSKVSSILLHYTPFLDALAKSFSDLAIAIQENLERFGSMFESNPEGMLMLWDAVNIDMERYMDRFSLESMAMKNIHHIHNPTSLSIRQIITLICPEEVETEEIEFF